jgi:hypothetical protein
MTHRSGRAIATLENAYRVANRIAAETDGDMQVAATGEPERPFVAEPTNDRSLGGIARIIVR